MSERMWHFRPLMLPSRSAAMSLYWIWSRPWWALISDSLRASVHLNSFPRGPGTRSAHHPLAAGLGPLDRLAQALGHQQPEHLFRDDLQLAPEAAADVGRDDPEL